jgi:DNA-binding PucR family transcriptional regulator
MSADLAPLLARLSHDRYARSVSASVLGPLLEYDRATGRNLLETLEVYLAESGNASAAARRLYLNRHSLLYRLRKIERLTGCSLEAGSDRFVLDLSVRVLRTRTAGARARAPRTRGAGPGTRPTAVSAPGSRTA